MYFVKVAKQRNTRKGFSDIDEDSRSGDDGIRVVGGSVESRQVWWTARLLVYCMKADEPPTRFTVAPDSGLCLEIKFGAGRWGSGIPGVRHNANIGEESWANRMKTLVLLLLFPFFLLNRYPWYLTVLLIKYNTGSTCTASAPYYYPCFLRLSCPLDHVSQTY